LRAVQGDDEGRDAHLKAARSWLTRSHKADGNRFQTLVRYADSLGATERFTSENTLNIMLLAQELAPQVSEVAMKTASVLIAHKKYDHAERLLLPLAADAHNPGLAAAAQRMLALAMRRGAAPAVNAKAEEAEAAAE
jgi:thioredoxin-like negative regulator of GroEL